MLNFEIYYLRHFISRKYNPLFVLSVFIINVYEILSFSLFFVFAELVKKYRNYLTDVEFEELKVYKEIWYFGQNASKNYNKTTTNGTANVGFDDDNGNYKIVSRDD